MWHRKYTVFCIMDVFGLKGVEFDQSYVSDMKLKIPPNVNLSTDIILGINIKENK